GPPDPKTGLLHLSHSTASSGLISTSSLLLRSCSHPCAEGAFDASERSTAEDEAPGAARSLEGFKHQSSSHPAGGRAAGIGQPEPRDRLTQAWLLSQGRGSAEPTKATDTKCRQGDRATRRGRQDKSDHA